ncbi:MAG: PhoH family protein, partial [Robiginitomaculum sp.]|nr:PhoH family protein [Robiginitomaculum sp.]
MKTETLELKFGNASAFRNLCGVNHRNLAQIEREFGVNIQAPGGKMIFEGKASAISLASKAASRLFERAVTGINISEAEVLSVLSFSKTGMEKMQLDQISFNCGSKRINPRNPAQQSYMQMLKDQNNDLVFGSGPAGTGKTFLAIAYGASLLLSKQVERMVVARPALEAGERLGFLPGDFEEKVDPYMMPIWDAFTQTIGAEKFARLKENGKIEIAPLAFMRGRTFAGSYIVLDEAQKAT